MPRLSVLLTLVAALLHAQNSPATSDRLAVQVPSGLRLLVSPANSAPTLRILLPGHPQTDTAIEVLLPEHVTATRAGDTEPKRLYLFQPGPTGPGPAWHRKGQSLEYETDLPDHAKTGPEAVLHLLARATLEDDGVLFHYELTSPSHTAYTFLYAPTDPRLTGQFHDERLERTYIHDPTGFHLIADETPARLTMPSREWLPARYHASYTWPVPAKLVDRRSDGITNYDRSTPVDQPMIATLSTDHTWVVASFTRTVGNVWTNPELTCQHVDPTPSLATGQRAVIETKLLILHGTLNDALQKVIAQRETLQ